jgi:hypothetical protein
LQFSGGPFETAATRPPQGERELGGVVCVF